MDDLYYETMDSYYYDLTDYGYSIEDNELILAQYE